MITTTTPPHHHHHQTNVILPLCLITLLVINIMSPQKSNNKEVYTLRWNDWLPHLQDQLRALKKQQLFADLTVVTEEGTTFHTHKVVLANSSLILNSVLKESEFAETLILHEISGREFESILDFVYDGQVNISQDDLPRFFSAAQSLGVKGLVNNNNNNNNQQQRENESGGGNSSSNSSSILVKALLSKRSRRSSEDEDDERLKNKLVSQEEDDQRLEEEEEEGPSDEEEEEEDIGEEFEDATSQSSFTKPPKSLSLSHAMSTGTTQLASSSSLMLSSSSSRIRATDPRPCPKCGKIYRSAHTLRTHLEDKHTVCPGYRCVLCGTVAKSRNSLHSHMSRQHRGISTKDLPVLPMPAPFDPELARRLLTGQTLPPQQIQQQFFGSSPGGGGGGGGVIGGGGGRVVQQQQHQHHHKSNGGGGTDMDSSSTEASSATGSAILDTYLQFIAENTLFK